ncbi:PREDICTED: LOW QUALITY PROTEIN: microtubule-associated protein Jupiter [Atta cephalotes]|uniref:Microtubule-associated protein Jupiter n=1 Tax=Atta cephalotes TaxID=12957 RepID=A0A158NSK2_ATTCE|nr:PREDICTED: LOW QUALITY PROTEIN: microtubule-associated protein Jupiter [Atta cephalotes]XP_018056286.1 PREDICTED: microtubule-associated protein Jupiter isoform X1 [Atta colombica]
MATYATYRHVELDNVGYGKKRVLKPPGGGSSDIFGAAPEETSPRRIKAHNQSQLSSALFGDTNGTDNATAAVSPRSNKPGNDSYKRLFGPPDAPSTPNARNHMRSNIPLSGESSISSQSSGTAMSPAKSTTSNNSTSGIANGYASNGSNSSNDMTAFRRKKRFRGLPTRNPVTGDGIEVTPMRRIPRKYRDGNPVTGIGYASESQKNGPAMQNGIASSNSSNSGEKSNDTSPATAKPPTRTRVPPGGYSSGLW